MSPVLFRTQTAQPSLRNRTNDCLHPLCHSRLIVAITSMVISRYFSYTWLTIHVAKSIESLCQSATRFYLNYLHISPGILARICPSDQLLYQISVNLSRIIVWIADNDVCRITDILLFKSIFPQAALHLKALQQCVQTRSKLPATAWQSLW